MTAVMAMAAVEQQQHVVPLALVGRRGPFCHALVGQTETEVACYVM